MAARHKTCSVLILWVTWTCSPLKRLNFIKTVKCKLCPAVHFAAEVLIVIIIISERSALSINERNTCVQVTD